MNEQNANLHPTPLSIPEIEEGQNLAAYLKQLRQEFEKEAIETINWYIKSKKIKKRLSLGLRGITILATSIGGLVPLLQGAGFTAIHGQYGYIALAIAATCIGLDKFMGFSSSWMRYIITDFSLQKALAEFQTDWILMWSEVENDSPTKEQQEKILCHLKNFRLKIQTEIQQETQMWTNEFQSNLAQLQMSTRARLESYQPGIIDLTVTNAIRAKQGLNVMIDSLTVAYMRSPQLQIGHVLPGQHKITVHGMVDGHDVQASSVVNMTPNALVELKLSLPIN
jgi:hypothetical protein